MSLSYVPLEEAWGNQESLFKKKKNKYADPKFQKEMLKQVEETKQEIIEPKPQGISVTLTDPQVVSKLKIYSQEHIVSMINNLILKGESVSKSEHVETFVGNSCNQNPTLLILILLTFLVIDVMSRLK